MAGVADGGIRPFSRFRRDFARAARICVRDPRLPLVTLSISMFASVWSAVATSTGDRALGSLWFLSLAFVGIYGAERVWFVLADRGLRLTWAEFRALMFEMWGRFFRLGLMVFLVFLIPAVVLTIAAARTGYPGTAVVLGIGLVIDFLLTFATSCLAFNDVSAFDAIGHSCRVIRDQWPSSLWYVLAAPFGITLATQFLPAHSLDLAPLLLLDLAIAAFALLCKGATVLFYAEHYPTLDADQVAAGERALRRPDDAPESDFWHW